MILRELHPFFKITCSNHVRDMIDITCLIFTIRTKDFRVPASSGTKCSSSYTSDTRTGGRYSRYNNRGRYSYVKKKSDLNKIENVTHPTPMVNINRSKYHLPKNFFMGALLYQNNKMDTMQVYRHK